MRVPLKVHDQVRCPIPWYLRFYNAQRIERPLGDPPSKKSSQAGAKVVQKVLRAVDRVVKVVSLAYCQSQPGLWWPASELRRLLPRCNRIGSLADSSRKGGVVRASRNRPL